jgi:hypothetical protein
MNFYKITNEEETHRGLQYHDGLVVDTVPFNPNGTCEPGGIYFAREDILFFLDYGPWIRKVSIPGGAQVYKDKGKWKADMVYLHPRRRLTGQVVQALIDEGADPNVGGMWPLRWAETQGLQDIALVLSKYVSDKGLDPSLLNTAVLHSWWDVAESLLRHISSDKLFHILYALHRNGSTLQAERLLKRICERNKLC